MTTRTAIYLRISQDPNEDGLAHARQLADCEKIAKAHGWSTWTVYRDTVSASKRNVVRKEYDAMVKAFAAGEFDNLICWDLDRLTRQPRQLEDWVDLAETRQLKVITANGEADLTTDGGRMFARIKAAVAKQEGERKAARQKSKNLQLIAEGKPVPGRRRFGYKGDNMTPKPEEAKVVRAIFKSFLRTNGPSIWQLAKDYDRRTGWIREVLTNRAYCGEVKHRGRFYPSEHVVPLVSVKQMNDAADLLATPSRKTSPGGQPVHLLTSLAICECGANLVHQRGYRCRASTSHAWITAELLESVVLNAVLEWLVDGAEDHREASPHLMELITEAGEVRSAVTRWTLMGGNGDADARLVAQQLSDLRRRGQVLQSLIETERASAATSGFIAMLKDQWTADYKGKAVASIAFASWWPSLTLAQQRDVVRAMGTVILHKGRGTDRIAILRNAVKVRVI